MKNNDQKKLYLISGFLGAGKTTFMQNLIDFFKEENIAVIVNEFGKQGMDGLLLQKDGINIEQISNGSIFCNCRSETFINALVKIAELPVTTVLIESSGLSDPTGMGKIMSIVQESTMNIYDFKGAIAIVDVSNFKKLVYAASAVRLQIISSDLIIINKIDLVDEGILNFTEKILLQINPLATVVKTSYGKIRNPNWITHLNNENSSSDMNIRKTKIIGIQKILVSMDGNFEKYAIESWISGFSRYFYRIKGFVSIEDRWCYVNGTSNQLDIYPSSIVPPEASIVILASGDQPVMRNMVESWNKYFKKELRLI